MGNAIEELKIAAQAISGEDLLRRETHEGPDVISKQATFIRIEEFLKKRKTHPITLLHEFPQIFREFQGVQVELPGITISIGTHKDKYAVSRNRKNDMVLVGVDTMVPNKDGIARYYKQYILERNPFGINVWQFLGGNEEWEKIDAPNDSQKHLDFIHKIINATYSGGPVA